MRIRNAQQLGRLMRARRRELGLTQQQLADRLGRSKPWVLQVEKGKDSAEVGLILEALTGLGLEVDVRDPTQRATGAMEGVVPDLEEILSRARGVIAPKRGSRKGKKTGG